MRISFRRLLGVFLSFILSVFFSLSRATEFHVRTPLIAPEKANLFLHKALEERLPLSFQIPQSELCSHAFLKIQKQDLAYNVVFEADQIGPFDLEGKEALAKRVKTKFYATVKYLGPSSDNFFRFQVTIKNFQFEAQDLVAVNGLSKFSFQKFTLNSSEEWVFRAEMEMQADLNLALQNFRWMNSEEVIAHQLDIDFEEISPGINVGEESATSFAYSAASSILSFTGAAAMGKAFVTTAMGKTAKREFRKLFREAVSLAEGAKIIVQNPLLFR